MGYRTAGILLTHILILIIRIRIDKCLPQMFFGNVCPLLSAFGISFNRSKSENQNIKLKAIIQNTL